MKTKSAAEAALLAALLLPLAASAQDAETVTVTATGYGVDPAAAKKAAFAVSKIAIGSCIW